MMYCHVYLRKGTVYVPTVAKTEAGFYMNVEPVSVTSVSSRKSLQNVLHEVMARGTPVIPTPKRNAYPPPLLPKYAGLKTDRAFMQGTSHWAIDERGGNYQIIGYRVHSDGYWVQDAAQKIDFPANASAGDVVDRMIAMLQDTERP
jgi:hypothetical protein